jgi:hypothetical protein
MYMNDHYVLILTKLFFSSQFVTQRYNIVPCWAVLFINMITDLLIFKENFKAMIVNKKFQ